MLGACTSIVVTVLALAGPNVSGRELTPTFAYASPSTPTRPSGLIQAGSSRSTCVYVPYVDHSLRATLQQVEPYTHVKYRCLVTYSDADTTWGEWVKPWLTEREYGYRQWLAADPRSRTIVITQSLVPHDVDLDPDWAATCASGAFHTYDVKLGQNLVRAGFGYSVIRLGPEMNGNWEYDSLGDSPTAWHQWGECFAQIVEGMRSVRGQHFLFDWNVNAGYRVIPLADFYPGNAYVDIVGIDAYDSSPALDLPPVGTAARWHDLISEPLGLEAVYRFARAHGKPLSIPEWGTLSGSQAGDDPTYVAAMGHFVATGDIAYESWFDATGNGVMALTPDSAPKSLAAYIAEFGPGSHLAEYQTLHR